MTLIEYQLATIGGKPEVLATWRDEDGPLLAYHSLQNGRCNMVMAYCDAGVPDLPADVLATLQDASAAEKTAAETILEAVGQ
jgi:hypothetical protein